jgi:hypothetical protein
MDDEVFQLPFQVAEQIVVIEQDAILEGAVRH